MGGEGRGTQKTPLIFMEAEIKQKGLYLFKTESSKTELAGSYRIDVPDSPRCPWGCCTDVAREIIIVRSAICSKYYMKLFNHIFHPSIVCKPRGDRTRRDEEDWDLFKTESSITELAGTFRPPDSPRCPWVCCTVVAREIIIVRPAICSKCYMKLFIHIPTFYCV